MIKIAICDNEQYDLNNLHELIEKSFNSLDQYVKIDLFDNGIDLIEVIEKHKRIYDIIFLDVDMPELDGFRTASRLQEIKSPHFLIFVTNMEGGAREGYRYAAFRYVYKGNLQAEVSESITAVLERLDLTRKDEVFVNLKYKFGGVFENIQLKTNDVIYLKKEKNRRITLKTVQAEYELLVKPLSDYQIQFPSFELLTRYYLINFTHIIDLDKDFFILSNNEKIPLGFTQETKRASKEKYMQFLKKRL